jgi:hypothetical protein
MITKFPQLDHVFFGILPQNQLKENKLVEEKPEEGTVSFET